MQRECGVLDLPREDEPLLAGKLRGGRQQPPEQVVRLGEGRRFPDHVFVEKIMRENSIVLSRKVWP
jgi:hypothetical protein